MKEIAQIRSLSLWIFLVPLISINICLLISVNYDLLENTYFIVDQIGRSGFTIPYLDGSLSISRASRTFPQYLIFKPGMAITAILLCFYWYKNNLLINHFTETRFKKNTVHEDNVSAGLVVAVTYKSTTLVLIVLLKIPDLVESK